MSSTKSRPAAKSAAAVTPAARSPVSRRRWIAAGALALAAIAAATIGADWYYGIPEGAESQFVGRQSCITCHQDQHEQWQGSHHDLAMDRATEETVLGDFNDAELTHHGITSRMFRRDEKFFIATEGPSGEIAEFEVKYVLGVDPLQQYMVEFDRPADMPEHEVARLQVLRVSWDTHKNRWFHLDPPDVKTKLDPSDDLHWTGVAQRWNNMCADCHTTNLRKGYDVASGVYHTTFSEIDVSCETCHGPGSLHVELAQSKSLFWDRKRGYALAQLKGKESQGEIQACAQCHSRRRIVQAGFSGGCNYYDYFANELLSPGAYHADGQILDEVYEYGSFIQSKMYHKGVRCTDCHDPHTARLKLEGNKVCTDCHQHPAGKYDAFVHHRHPEDSKGAQCVECHMPQTTYMQVDPRRDHSLRIPRPDLSVKLGTANSCTGCHLRDERLPGEASSRVGQASKASAGPPDSDLHMLLAREDLKEYADWLRLAANGDEPVRQRLAQVDRWADETLTKWYGVDRKREPHFAEALHAAREMTPDAPKKLLDLLENRSMPAVARATAALELGSYVEPEGPIERALEKALEDRDPQVRTAAVMSLQEASSDGIVGALIPLLGADQPRLVRTETARVLARIQNAGLRGDERVAMKKALDECFAAAEVDSDRAAGHLMVGILYENLQELDKAAEAYRTAIRVEPTAAGPRTNLASLYDQMIGDAQAQINQLVQIGDQETAARQFESIGVMQAEAARLRDEELGLLERDAALVPENAGLQGRIGFARHLEGWRKEAETGLLNAHLLEPRNPEHAFRLAIYYRDTGRPEMALKLVALLRELRPNRALFAQFEQELRQAGPGAPP